MNCSDDDGMIGEIGGYDVEADVARTWPNLAMAYRARDQHSPNGVGITAYPVATNHVDDVLNACNFVGRGGHDGERKDSIDEADPGVMSA